MNVPTLVRTTRGALIDTHGLLRAFPPLCLVGFTGAAPTKRADMSDGSRWRLGFERAPRARRATKVDLAFEVLPPEATVTLASERRRRASMRCSPPSIVIWSAWRL
jgi:hypothetical protein